MAIHQYPENVTNLQSTWLVIHSYRVISNFQNPKTIVKNKSLKRVRELESSYYLPMPDSGNSDGFTTEWDMIDTSLADGNIGQVIAKGVSAALDGAGVGKSLRLAGGYNLDQNTMPLFENIAHRKFNFSWTFTPRSATDSDALSNVINGLRADVLPDQASYDISGTGQGVSVLTFPNIFNLSYSKTDGSLTKFHKDGYICDSIDVQFNDGATWYEFSNGDPVTVTLTASFTEIRRMTKTEYQKQFHGAG